MILQLIALGYIFRTDKSWAEEWMALKKSLWLKEFVHLQTGWPFFCHGFVAARCSCFGQECVGWRERKPAQLRRVVAGDQRRVPSKEMCVP